MAEQNAGVPSGQIVSGQPVAEVPTNDKRLETAPASAPGKAPAKKKPEAPMMEPKDSLREIVETVVFVVVLVLLLKSFVAEAFVIPTGSMAETLYGYQKNVTCPKCHFEFPVNCSNEVDPQQGPPIPVTACTCPVCRYHINFKDEGMTPGWNSGDRVLVAKFLYDLNLFGFNGPKRGNVVVFKFPEEPQRNATPMNYIKRLIGLPGQTIAIYYGKLYVLEGMKYDDSGVKPEELWKKGNMHADDPEALARFHQGAFKIIRKTPAEMLSMRRPVYWNDFQAKDLIGKVPPRWAPVGSSEAWKLDKVDEPRRFQHVAGKGEDLDWVRYRNYIPDRDRSHAEIKLITDFMGYNTWEPHALPLENWVGDLILECVVDVEQGEGDFVLELSKGVDRFRARWDLASGMCTLVRITDGREEKLDTKMTTLKKKGTYRLIFANVDERLTVWVDSGLPFGDGVVYNPPQTRGPTENDLEPASIGVKGGGVTVSKLKLWRDTYYTVNVGDMAKEDSGSLNVDFSRPAEWDRLRHLEPKTLYVQPSHYLCLGDNSPESSDGRSWGLVPQRLLLGRALLIYFPFSIWPPGPGRAGRIE
jgi:signal peptidase I